MKENTARTEWYDKKRVRCSRMTTMDIRQPSRAHEAMPKHNNNNNNNNNDDDDDGVKTTHKQQNMDICLHQINTTTDQCMLRRTFRRSVKHRADALDRELCLLNSSLLGVCHGGFISHHSNRHHHGREGSDGEEKETTAKDGGRRRGRRSGGHGHLVGVFMMNLGPE